MYLQNVLMVIFISGLLYVCRKKTNYFAEMTNRGVIFGGIVALWTYLISSVNYIKRMCP